MQRLVEYADELVTSVGPRPSTSDAESGAADLIAANLEDLGLDTWIQEFTCPRSTRWIRIVYCLLGVVAAELLFVMPAMAPLALVLSLVVFALLALELLGKNPLSGLLGSGQSQNVVARYTPEGADPRRKVVVIAHYDSGRSFLQCAPPVVSFYTIINTIVRVCIAALVVVALLTLFPLPEVVLLFLSIIGLIIGIVLLIATIVEAVNMFMPATPGANNNASGVAAMMGVAETIVGVRGSAGLDTNGRSIEQLDEHSSEQGAPRRSSRRQGASKAFEAIGGHGALGTFDAYDDEQDSEAAVPSHEAKTGGFAAIGDAAGALFSRAKAAVDKKPSRSLENAHIEMDDDDVIAPSKEETAVPSLASLQNHQHPGAPIEQLAADPTRTEARAATRSAAQARQEMENNNPAIRVRPTVSEQEERDRALQEELQARAATQSERTEDGTPAWFVNAKKAAQQKENKASATTSSDTKVARSRFADVPVEYAPETREKSSAATETNAVKTETSSETQQQSASSYIDERPLTERAAAAPQREVITRETTQRETIHREVISREPAESEEQAAQETPAVPATTLNADFSGIDRLASDPLPTPRPKIRLPESASSLEQAAAMQSPDIPENDKLRNLPSLSLNNSGAIQTQQAAFDQHTLFEDEESRGSKKVSNTGSFAPLGATGIMKPVGEELFEYHEGDEQDIYIDDADDSGSSSFGSRGRSREESPSMVDIPKSRAKSFFGSLGDRLTGGRNKADNLDSSPSAWLGVDEDYDARTEGSNIGGWDNFAEEDDDSWKGGAYGGETSEEDAAALSRFSSVLIDKEVWFVATGAHESDNAGIKALLNDHERELKSALFINLDGVGAGDLCFTMAEGTFRPRGTDHRLQGLIRSAANALGIDFAPVGLRSYNSDAFAASRMGARTISIVGLDKQLPLDWHWKDDRLDILDEDNLDAVADVVVEVIKSV